MSLFSQGFMLKIALNLLSSVSPLFLEGIKETIIRLRVAAKKSANPWDDILVDMLESFFANFSR